MFFNYHRVWHTDYTFIIKDRLQWHRIITAQTVDCQLGQTDLPNFCLSSLKRLLKRLWKFIHRSQVLECVFCFFDWFLWSADEEDKSLLHFYFKTKDHLPLMPKWYGIIAIHIIWQKIHSNLTFSIFLSHFFFQNSLKL